MNTQDMIEMLDHGKSLAVVRAETIADAGELCAALVTGGIPAVEFALTTPEALTHVARAAESAAQHGAAIGVGTVLHPDQARAAIDAGAQFLLTPGIRPEVAKIAADAGIPFCLGAMSPTEVAMALDLGSAVVRLYPAGTLGPQYLRDLLLPYPGIRLLPSGGVNSSNARAFLDAGALAVCSGTSVAPPELVAAGEYARITELATEFTSVLR